MMKAIRIAEEKQPSRWLVRLFCLAGFGLLLAFLISGHASSSPLEHTVKHREPGWLWLLLAATYLLGGCSPGYWMVRWRLAIDVRDQGSGGTGATNVGRLLGRGAFTAVLLLDAAKGAVAVAAVRWLNFPEIWAFAAAFAVVAGHVWPVQLGLRGGRGVAPLLGAWLVLAPAALVPCLIAALLALAALRRFTISALCGLALLPLAAWWATSERAATGLAAAMLVVVLCAHREHLCRWFWPQSAAP